MRRDHNHREIGAQLEAACRGQERAAQNNISREIGRTVVCPAGSGRMMNLLEVAREIADRLARIFLRDGSGCRPVYGGIKTFQEDPHWRDHILFYEYFHGDTGAGLDASRQTGWTGVVGKLIQLFGVLDPKRLLEGGVKGAFKAQAGQTGGAAGPRGR